MQTHDQFEQLCALAACGEIAPVESKRLEIHLDECASCRGVFADLRDIHAELLPAHDGFKRIASTPPDLKLRQAILDRVTKAGARFSEDAQPSQEVKALPLPMLSFGFRWSAVAVVALIAIVIGSSVVQRSRRTVTSRDAVAASSGIGTTVPASASSRPETSLATELTQARERTTLLEKRLIESGHNEAVRRNKLEEAQQKASVLQAGKAESDQAIAGLNAQLEANREERLRIEAELKKVQTDGATSLAITTVQQQEIRELNEKLEQKDSSLGRERDLLSAGREIRDLIAARNLHIIDVYDTDGNGKTSRAFGRVFYTEGRSLVFYAYDLNSQQRDAAKYAFYVWGKRDGSPQDIKSLGKLSKDDQAQKRWVLTITNPKTLAEIDSVFVTLELSDRPGAKPSGKPLLSAFLNSPPNHP